MTVQVILSLEILLYFASLYTENILDPKEVAPAVLIYCRYSYMGLCQRAIPMQRLIWRSEWSLPSSFR